MHDLTCQDHKSMNIPSISEVSTHISLLGHNLNAESNRTLISGLYIENLTSEVGPFPERTFYYMFGVIEN